eukprot:7596976-Heterocapsa_arctica.AAC.1
MIGPLTLDFFAIHSLMHTANGRGRVTSTPMMYSPGGSMVRSPLCSASCPTCGAGPLLASAGSGAE